MVKAATGVEVSSEELGGGEVHAKISGVVDHLARDDSHALEMPETLFQEQTSRPRKLEAYLKKLTSSLFDERIIWNLPSDSRQSYDVREVIARLVDGSEMQEFKSLYGLL